MQDANWHKLAWIIALLLMGNAVAAQEVVATLTARQTKVQVGRPFEIELSVRHPERTVVVFPDSAKDFKPYEVHSGKPIPTHTDAGISEDVKIYRLYTWEIDSVQRLQFPARYITPKGDTATVLSNEVLVEFLPTIHHYSDTLKVRVIENVAEIREPINWMAWGIIFSASLLLLLLLGFIFFKPVTKWLRRRRIYHEFRRYLRDLESLRTLGGDQSAFYPRLNRIWRNYFDRDWYLALGAMTTSELKEALTRLDVLDDADRKLLESLSEATDMVLYAGRQQPDAQTLIFWEGVRNILHKEFARRKEAAEV